VLCKHPSTGARSNPAPVIPDNPVQVSNAPISTNATPAPAELPVTQTFSPQALVCRECGNAKTERQKFCSRCTTRLRVARHRKTPVNKIKQDIQEVHNSYLRGKRHAICDQATLTERNETTSGLDTGTLKKLAPELAREQRIEDACKGARKKLRADSTTRRRDLKQQKRDALAKVRELSARIDAITPNLQIAIDLICATIRNHSPLA
jgi:hypothetical protein